jgi:dimethyladenosine transferase
MTDGIRAKKAFGQHFLADDTVLENIIKNSDIKEDDIILEIGPGKGVLTKTLAQRAKRVIAVEIDPDMVECTNRALEGFDNVEIVLGNIIKMDLDELIPKESVEGIKVIANIPYYITTSIIEWLLDNCDRISKAILMVQWEVAEKLTARTKTSNYSAISAKVSLCSDSKLLFKVPKTAFIPSPKVDSGVVSFEFKGDISDKKELFMLIDDSFRLRRKNIRNSFKSGSTFRDKNIDEVLSKCNIDPSKRGEELNIDDYVKILQAIKK